MRKVGKVHIIFPELEYSITMSIPGKDMVIMVSSKPSVKATTYKGISVKELIEKIGK